MKKYLFKRILFSIFSLLAVVCIVMILVYSLIDRKVIFQNDDAWNKRSANDRTMYEYNKWAKYDYLDYEEYNVFLVTKFKAEYGEDYAADPTIKAKYDQALGSINAAVYKNVDDINNDYVKQFLAEYRSKKYEIVYMPRVEYSGGRVAKGGTARLIAVHEKSVFIRLFNFLGQMVTFETVNDVKDPNLTDRYVKVIWDDMSNMPALVGSGTTHKYLIYFDDSFPYIHQNIVHFGLGVSSTQYEGSPIVEGVMGKATGSYIYRDQEYPAQVGTGIKSNNAYDFHTVTYSPIFSEFEEGKYNDNYTQPSARIGGLTRIGNSFVIGIIATIVAYIFGLPIGIFMALKKDKLVDKLGMMYIIFIMAVPSLAYIFIFSTIGTTLFKLPYKFANAQVPILAYILPTISLALPSIGGLMKWMRRYMIDQMNSDYVKFARAEGLSEREIFSKHISKNAMIYLVHGIPASILFCLTGAIITESVYGVPGIGRILTDAITFHDNGLIVAVTVFYTFLSIVALILGDLLLAKYDPRVSFTEKGGR